MADLNRALIERKIQRIIEYIEELKPIADLSYEGFLGDNRNFRTAERDLQLIIDAAVDINNHIIAATGKNPANDYFESFIKLSTLKVLPKKFADQIAPSTGLRNRLVHEYEDIDLSILFEDLTNDIKDYTQYCKYILKYIKN